MPPAAAIFYRATSRRISLSTIRKFPAMVRSLKHSSMFIHPPMVPPHLLMPMKTLSVWTRLMNSAATWFIISILGATPTRINNRVRRILETMNPEILPINKIRGILLLILMASAFISLGGCELLYYLQGNGEDKALYKIPKSDRVLVLVDSSAGSPMTIQATGSLIDSVNSQLYQNKAADQLVPSFRVMELERTNPVTYQQMGIADVAKSVKADVVVYIFLDRFNVQLDSDQQISQ